MKADFANVSFAFAKMLQEKLCRLAVHRGLQSESQKVGENSEIKRELPWKIVEFLEEYPGHSAVNWK